MAPRFRRRSKSITAHTSLRAEPPSAWGRQRRKARSQDQIAADLLRQLTILAARHASGEFEVPELGLIIQAHRNEHDSYAIWRASWDRRLRQIKAPGSRPGTLSAATWAEQIVEGGWGLILLGVRVGTTTMVDRSPRLKGASTSAGRRRESLLAAPFATQTVSPKLLRQSTAELMGMDLVSGLLGWTPDAVAPRLAPPILEWVTADGRRALSRKVLTWDLPWPLPAPVRG